MDDQELLRNFENLGCNCEFGLLQRYAGVESMGLLRWSSCSPKSVIAALENHFDGFREE